MGIFSNRNMMTYRGMGDPWPMREFPDEDWPENAGMRELRIFDHMAFMGDPRLKGIWTCGYLY